MTVKNRQKIIAGKYQIGDSLNGKKITGLGKKWTEGRAGTAQLWEECPRCGREPVYIDLGHLCQNCGGEPVTVCYAYFDNQ